MGDTREAPDRVFASFARVYPHETYAAFPEEFWELFQKERPGISRKKMERLLKETEREFPQRAKDQSDV